MQFIIHQHNQTQIAELVADEITIKNVQDALDLMANANYQGAWKIIIKEEHLAPAFFDLKTQLAGDILQKFSNYKTALAIIGDFKKYQSKSLRDFILESNKKKRILFVSSIDEVKDIW